MKLRLSLAFTLLSAAVVFADIQDPPVADHGPTRKLGRAISNIAFAPTEITTSIAKINDREGNSAAASYGVVKAVGRTFFRAGAGVYELVTFPFPTYKGSYRPFYRSNPPWINGGYEEFPPELGWNSKFNYSRSQTSY